MKHISEQGVKALEKVITWLEAGAPHVKIAEGIEIDVFAMEYSVETEHDLGDGYCGTACCIAGAVCQFEMLGMDKRSKNNSLPWDSSSRADTIGVLEITTEYLGISEEDAELLFRPFDYGIEPEVYNNPQHAAKVVRKFIATGVVDWELDEEVK